MHVEEVSLPGVGQKFTIRPHSGDEIVIVVQHNGHRQLLCYQAGMGDEPAAVLELSDEEAREVGAILSGVLFHPELTGAATARIAEQAMEWITVAGAVAGRRIGELPQVDGAHVLALNQNGVLLPHPSPDTQLHAGDTLVVAGTRGAVDGLKARLGA